MNRFCFRSSARLPVQPPAKRQKDLQLVRGAAEAGHRHCPAGRHRSRVWRRDRTAKRFGARSSWRSGAGRLRTDERRLVQLLAGQTHL